MAGVAVAVCDDMSRVTSYLIGCSPECDFVIDGSRVAERHAEVTPVADGRYHITDRGSGRGTFVQRAGQWRAIQQDFVSSDETLRFGDREIAVHTLADLLDPGVVAGRSPTRRSAHSTPRGPNPDAPLMRDPLTGEIVENAQR